MRHAAMMPKTAKAANAFTVHVWLEGRSRLRFMRHYAAQRIPARIILSRQLFSALGTAGSEHVAAILGLHALTETVHLRALALLRLKGHPHGHTLLYKSIKTGTGQCRYEQLFKYTSRNGESQGFSGVKKPYGRENGANVYMWGKRLLRGGLYSGQAPKKGAVPRLFGRGTRLQRGAFFVTISPVDPKGSNGGKASATPRLLIKRALFFGWIGAKQPLVIHRCGKACA